MSDKPKRYVQTAGGSEGMVVELIKEEGSEVILKQVENGTEFRAAKRNLEQYYKELDEQD